MFKHVNYIYERRCMNGWCKMLHGKMLKNIIHCCCVQSLSLCDSMDCSTWGFPVLHHPLEFIQTYIHWISDATQPSHSLSSPSAPAFNLSQHQGLFQWVSSLHQVAKLLELQLQHQFFQWIFSPSNEYSVLPMNIPLGWTGWISLQSKGLSRVFSNITVQHCPLRKCKFKSQWNVISHPREWL